MKIFISGQIVNVEIYRNINFDPRCLQFT